MMSFFHIGKIHPNCQGDATSGPTQISPQIQPKTTYHLQDASSLGKDGHAARAPPNGRQERARTSQAAKASKASRCAAGDREVTIDRRRGDAQLPDDLTSSGR